MCGIATILGTRDDASLPARLARMQQGQQHRGPDGRGSSIVEVGASTVGLAHLRLAILDLSEAATQPMWSRDGQSALVFNGEIYNYRELAAELETDGVRLRTASDTEVLLELLHARGPSCLEKCNGMWAFAWLDLRAQRLVFARDRFGVKPLYRAAIDGRQYFASEIKSVLAGAATRVAPSARAVGHFLHQSLLDVSTETFFSGVNSVEAGSLVEIDLREGHHEERNRRYYSLRANAAETSSVDDAVARVRATFDDAVRLRLRSDVPVGVLLSGGVDSSAIAATMQRLLGRDADLHLISAVSDDPRYDEGPFIDKMAAHLGRATHKVSLNGSAAEAYGLLPEVTWHHDEPVGSFSYVAHYLLMREARRLGVTVVLSGQGADEILCGYRKYLGFYLQSLLHAGRPIEAARVFAGFVGRGTIVSQFRFSEAKRYLPTVLASAGGDLHGERVREAYGAVNVGVGTSVVDRQVRDVLELSVPSLVHYEDRTSMAFGREIRLPFLDYRLVEDLTFLDPSWKLRDGWTKWLFRKAMADRLPPEIVWRRDKKGFTSPQERWLRSDLQPQVERMLAEPMAAEALGLVDRRALQRRYRAYCVQRAGWGRIDFKDVFNAIAVEFWARSFSQHLL